MCEGKKLLHHLPYYASIVKYCNLEEYKQTNNFSNYTATLSSISTQVATIRMRNRQTNGISERRLGDEEPAYKIKERNDSGRLVGEEEKPRREVG